MKQGKTSKQLPNRKVLSELTRKPPSLGDYSKASPLTPTEEPATILNLAKKR